MNLIAALFISAWLAATGRISAFVSPFSELSFRSVRAIGVSLRHSRSRTLDLTKSLDAIDDRPQEIDAVL